MCFQQTRIESYAANVVIDTIISVGTVIALCATDPKLIVWLSRIDGRSMNDVQMKVIYFTVYVTLKA
jgi:hypothetical protein